MQWVGEGDKGVMKEKDSTVITLLLYNELPFL